MVASKIEILRRKELEGRAILQMKPMDREAYAAWSDSTREAVGEALGSGSQLFRELVAARRTISVRFEVDPSYYLTQLAANLRRELAIVRKCLQEMGASEGAAREEQGAPAARGALASPPRMGAAAAEPAVAVETPPPAPREETPRTCAQKARTQVPKLLVYSEREGRCARAVLAALDAWGARAVFGLERLFAMRDALRKEAQACAVVVAADLGPEDARASRSSGCARAACAVGFLAALLGPARVSVVFEDEEPLLGSCPGVLQVAIADPDGWRPKVLKAFRAAGADLA